MTMRTPFLQLHEAVAAASPTLPVVGASPWHWLLVYALFLGLGCATILLHFRVQHYFVTLDVAIALCCLFLFGPIPAAWLMVAAAIAHALGASRRTRRGPAFLAANLASNCGNRVFRVLAAGWVYSLAGGGTPLAEISFRPGIGDAAATGWLPPLAATATLVIVNNGLFVPAEWTAGRSVAKFIRRMGSADLPVALVALPLALVLALTWVTAGLFPFLLLAGLVLVVSHTLKQMVESRRELNHRIDELQTLNVVGEAICSTAELDALLSLVYAECRKILDFTTFSIALRDAETGEFRVELLAEEDRFLQCKDAGPVEGLVATVADTGSPLMARRCDEIQAAVGKSGTVTHESAVCAPLLSQEGVLGVICAQHHLPVMYGEENLRALTTVAHQASVALRNFRLHRRATRDPLTDLVLRPVLMRRLEEELFRSKRHGYPVQVMVLDVDRFKEINDTHGHAAGDLALQQVAEAVRASLRSDDLPARFGGDEFVVLLPGAGRETCLRIAHRIRRELEALQLSMPDATTRTPVTVSIGVAGAEPHEATEPKALLDTADQALYRAKREGRNRVATREDPDTPEPSADPFPELLQPVEP